jgi:phage terminase large subunit-like protein
MGSWEAFKALRQAMDSTAREPRYYIGVDLGQSRDPTAIAVVRRVEPLGPAEDDFGLKPKPNYQPGSVEWQEEQRRRKK